MTLGLEVGKQVTDRITLSGKPSIQVYGCVFRPKLISDSGANQLLIPVETDHRFRAKPIRDSGGKLISFVAGTGIV